jgi:hypothetical protein
MADMCAPPGHRAAGNAQSAAIAALNRKAKGISVTIILGAARAYIYWPSGTFDTLKELKITLERTLGR